MSTRFVSTVRRTLASIAFLTLGACAQSETDGLDPRSVTALDVTPGSVIVRPGETQQFVAQVSYSDGTAGTEPVSWSATGGVVSESGLFAAGTVEGSFSVSALHAASGKSRSADVTVSTDTALPPPGAFTPTMPEGPRVLLNTVYVASTGTRVDVSSGGNLQTALNGAACGSDVVLAPGAVFTGNFTLPAKGCGTDNRIVIRSGGTLPAEGVRMTPALATSLARIVTPNSDPAIRTAASASGYRIMGVEVTVGASVTLNYGIVSLGAGEATLAEVPTDIILDRVFIHGTTTGQVRRCVALNSRSTAIIDSYLSDCHDRGSDSQAICGWLGAGPYKIVNNRLEGAGQNIMFGGGDPNIQDVVPSDIEIRRNHLFKPLAWQAAGWQVKNILELKNARRVVIEGNVLENHWIQAQSGFAIVMFSVNQNKSAPWTTVQDILWRSNIIKNIPSGFNLAPTNNYDGEIGIPLARVAIVNNLVVDIGVGGGGRIYQFLGNVDGLTDVTVENNTTVFAATNSTRSSAVMFDGARHRRLSLRNNIMESGSYGVIRSGGGAGTIALTASADPYMFAGNVVAGDLSGAAYPPGNGYPPSLSTVGFVNAAGGDFTLGTTSAYRLTGTDRRNPGVDMAALSAATSGVAAAP